MSAISPAATTPPRRRDGNWGGYNSYEYDSSPYQPYGHHPSGPPRGGPPPGGYYGGPPPSPAQYGGLPPPPAHHPHADYWSSSYEQQGPPPPPPPRSSAYWGPPPSYADSYHHQGGDRRMPPPSTRGGPRGPHRSSSSAEELSPPSPHSSRLPSSPGRGGYNRGHIARKRGDFQPPAPARSVSDDKRKRTGDPLSILANVSADMEGKDGERKAPPSEDASVPMLAPASPLLRRSRPSPITPNQTSPDNQARTQRVQITPSTSGGGRPPLEQHGSWDYDGGYTEQFPPPPSDYYPQRRRGYGEYSPLSRQYAAHSEPSTPTLVERGSFDSQVEVGSYRERHSYHPYYYEDQPQGPPPPPPLPPHGGYGGGPGYWEPPYPPPRYNYNGDWNGYEGGPPPPVEDGYGRPPPPPPVAPYSLVQQPRLEEKTILRKKFSWKHYPELERFLIANRDEYLKHSNMNYTAEQKQYNNWLTERLLELASQHNYVFDPEDFNFVAIRDRIRCYYKSYVQIARKRGLKLPAKKKD